MKGMKGHKSGVKGKDGQFGKPAGTTYGQKTFDSANVGKKKKK